MEDKKTYISGEDGILMEKRWDLSGLVPPAKTREFDRFLEKLDADVKMVEAARSRLEDFSGKEFLEIIKVKERIAESSNRLSAYAYLWFSEDTSNSKARAFLSRVEDLSVGYANRIVFFNLWFKGLEEKKARKLVKAAPGYGYFLTRIRELKQYSLKEEEEKIINLKDLSGNNTLTKVYDMITAGFTFPLIVNGEKKMLSQEELKKYFRHHDGKMRAAAYRSVYRVFGEQGQVLGEIYRSLVNDWKNEQLVLRRYKSPVAVRNIANDVPEEAYHALLNVVRKNVGFFQSYFDLKFKVCGVKEKSRYHIYAPYQAAEKKMSYESAVKLVLENFRKVSPRMADLAENVVKQNHVDVEIKKGKRSGAFCYSITTKITPYVLLNYDGTVRDVFTLAHELGHAVHGQLASKHSVLTFHAPIPLAETASIFSEMMLFEKLTNEEKSSELRKGMLIQKLDDVYGSIGRQAYFTFFEENAHRMVAEGAGVDELKAEYLKELREQFGSINVPEEFQWEWTYIPHIYHSPFYCYGYSFGNLLTLTLYERYKEEGASFVPEYLKILEAGGSESPQKVLERAGMDICSEKFWQSGFEVIEKMVNDLKKMR